MRTVFIDTHRKHFAEALSEIATSVYRAVGKDGKVDFSSLPIEDLLLIAVNARMLYPKLPGLAREAEAVIAEKMRSAR